MCDIVDADSSLVLDPGAIVQDEVALHFTIGHDGKSESSGGADGRWLS